MVWNKRAQNVGPIGGAASSVGSSLSSGLSWGMGSAIGGAVFKDIAQAMTLFAIFSGIVVGIQWYFFTGISFWFHFSIEVGMFIIALAFLAGRNKDMLISVSNVFAWQCGILFAMNMARADISWAEPDGFFPTFAAYLAVMFVVYLAVGFWGKYFKQSGLCQTTFVGSCSTSYCSYCHYSFLFTS